MKYTLRLLLVVLLTSASKLALAQAGNIIGQVKDEKGITVIGANVEVIEGQLKKGGAITDDDGKFNIRAIFAGTYNVRVSYPGYQISEISGVIVSVDKTTTLTFNLEKKGVTGKEVKVVAYKKPLIDKFSPGSTSVLTSKEIEKLPTEIRKIWYLRLLQILINKEAALQLVLVVREVKVRCISLMVCK